MSGEKGSIDEKEVLVQQQPTLKGQDYGSQPQPQAPQQPPGGYGAPPPGYGQPVVGQPPAGYGQPPAVYGQPPAGYGQPAPGYGPPAPGYVQPYGPPVAGYGQPPQQYGGPPPPPPSQQYPPPQPVIQQPGVYQVPQVQQPGVQVDPTQSSTWQSVVTADGQLGTTVPAPPPYTPPQGAWYTAPIVTVVLPQALSAPPNTYYNMSESWDEYLVRTRNKWTIGLAACTICCLCNFILGPIGIYLACRSNKHMDKKEGKEANKKSCIAVWLIVMWIILAFILLPTSAIIHAKMTHKEDSTATPTPWQDSTVKY